MNRADLRRGLVDVAPMLLGMVGATRGIAAVDAGAGSPHTKKSVTFGVAHRYRIELGQMAG